MISEHIIIVMDKVCQKHFSRRPEKNPYWTGQKLSVGPRTEIKNCERNPWKLRI